MSLPDRVVGHEVPVVKRLANGNRLLPDTVKVRPPNLPEYLQEDQLGGGVSVAEVNQLIAQARADVLAQVNAMLQNLPTPHVAFIFNQPVPVNVVTVEHNLGRRAVAVTVYSDDYETQYEFFEVYPVDENRTTLSFDDATAFVAVFS
ncbi:hypothetical protein SEA_KABOCHA_39 [Gordonia phage Kabocha]|nr:hypothetical protein PBI_GRAY_38 [Gordonia phage Gray]WAA19826.1 hypothetical protein SEA_KABOCHA_39 [Gordonia phage Kabocha]WAA20016.1 hypothetical protein SEA_HANEM_38 [Gordonia phage Hanem]WNM67058.1 hypothetical protein SEA_SCHOMBER_37 [Gordonia Phage Schomber]